MTRNGRGFRLGVAALALVAAAAAEPAPASADRPVRGAISGEAKIEFLPDLGLGWAVEATSDGLLLSARRPGVDLAFALRPDRAGAWTWAVSRGALDLAELWPLARAKLGEEAAGWSASGRIELMGEGTWSPEAGPLGELRLALREGWARSDELDVELSGVEFDMSARDFTAGALSPTQSLRVGKIAAAGAEAGPVRLRFGFDPAQGLEVAEGVASILGGTVRLRPFRVAFENPSVNAAADVDALRLDEAARLLPWLVQSAQGVLRGRVELSWSETGGLRVKDGGLAIVKSDDAAFRLAPSPGLLTARFPKRYPLLGKWVTFNNPAWAPLREIELGKTGLRIETFRVEFQPDGPGRGRTAAIHIVGRPTDGKLVKEVRLDLNFHGPWSEFLAFGLNNDLSAFSFRFE